MVILTVVTCHPAIGGRAGRWRAQEPYRQPRRKGSRTHCCRAHGLSAERKAQGQGKVEPFRGEESKHEGRERDRRGAMKSRDQMKDEGNRDKRG